MNAVSPCIGICRQDEATGYCLGCARTCDEITDWKTESDAWRAKVWDALPKRFKMLEIVCRRLPWDTEEIQSFVLNSIRGDRGTWTAGVVGAVGEFAVLPGESVEAELDGDTVIATTLGGRLRFLINNDIRPLTFDPPGTPTEELRVILAVKKKRGHPDLADALTLLGKDAEAIDPAETEADMFDLGLGRKEARFCIRVGKGATKDLLTGAAGATFPASLGAIAPKLLAESPTRVVETALGRIEVMTAIPEPEGKSPPGPHTHLLPDHIASNRAMPVGMDLPKPYFPGATFYPRT